MARRLISVTLALLLLVSVFALPASAASTKNTTVRTTNKGDTLRVRKGPGKGDTPTMAYVKNGTAIKLYCDSSDDEGDPEAWSKIKVTSSGAVGYLKNKYILYLIREYDLWDDNANGELDPDEDEGEDIDGDGHRGSGSSGSTTKYARVDSSGGAVNVRSGPGTGYRRLGTASHGEKLIVLGKSGSWQRVKTARGYTGYISGSYVVDGANAYTTASRGVNMRKGAGTGYAVVKSLPYNTYIEVYYTKGSWSYVRAGTRTGYIYSTYHRFS